MAGPVDKKVVRWESQERVDVPDASQVVRSIVDYHESIVGTLFSHAAVIGDWKVSKNSNTSIKVERLSGGALISPEIGSTDSVHADTEIGYSIIVDTGATSKIKDVSALAANAYYTVWVETKFLPSTSDTRVKWSHASDSEYIDTMNTRYDLTWGVHLLPHDQQAAAASYVRVGTIYWDGSAVVEAKIYQTGQMLFEGLALGADPTDGTGGHLASGEAVSGLDYKIYPLPDFTRSSNRWLYGAKDMASFCHMVLKKVEEMQDATGATPWWSKPTQSLANMFGTGVNVGTGQGASKGLFNGTAVTVDGVTYYDITKALKSASEYLGLDAEDGATTTAGRINILPGRYIMTSRLTMYLHTNLVISGAGSDCTHIYTASASQVTGAAATTEQGLHIAHPSDGAIQSFEMRDIKWLSWNSKGGSDAPVHYSLQYINPSWDGVGPLPASSGQGRFKFSNIVHEPYPSNQPALTIPFLKHKSGPASSTTGKDTQWEFINCSFFHYGGVIISSGSDVRMIDCNPLGPCYIGSNDATAQVTHHTYVSKLHVLRCHEGSVYAEGIRKQVFVDGCTLSSLMFRPGEENLITNNNFRSVVGLNYVRSATNAIGTLSQARIHIDSGDTGNTDAVIDIKSCRFQPAGLPASINLVKEYSECRITDCFFGTTRKESDATADTVTIIAGSGGGTVVRTPTVVSGCTFRNSGATIFESVDIIKDCIVQMENSYCNTAFVKNTALDHTDAGNDVDRTILGVTVIDGLDAVFAYSRMSVLFENVVSLRNARLRLDSIQKRSTSGGISIAAIVFTDHAPIPWGIGSIGQGESSPSSIPAAMHINTNLSYIDWQWRNVELDLTSTATGVAGDGLFQVELTNTNVLTNIDFENVLVHTTPSSNMPHGDKAKKFFEICISDAQHTHIKFNNVRTNCLVGLRNTAGLPANSELNNINSLSVKNCHLGSLYARGNFYNTEITASTIDYGLEVERDVYEPDGHIQGRDVGMGHLRVTNCRVGLMDQSATFDHVLKGPQNAGLFLNEPISANADDPDEANLDEGWFMSNYNGATVTPGFASIIPFNFDYRPRVAIGVFATGTAKGVTKLYDGWDTVVFSNNYVRAMEIYISAARECGFTSNTIRLWPNVGNTDKAYLTFSAASWKVAKGYIGLESERIRMHDNDIEIRYGHLDSTPSEWDYIRLSYNMGSGDGTWGYRERPILWTVINNKVSDTWGNSGQGHLQGGDTAGQASTDIRSEGAAVFKFFVTPDHQGPVAFKIASNIVTADLRRHSSGGTYLQPMVYKQVGLTYSKSDAISAGTLAGNNNDDLTIVKNHPNAAGLTATLIDNIYHLSCPEADQPGADDDHFYHLNWEPMASAWWHASGTAWENAARHIFGNNITKAFAITKGTT